MKRPSGQHFKIENIPGARCRFLAEKVIKFLARITMNRQIDVVNGWIWIIFCDIREKFGKIYPSSTINKYIHA